MIMRIIPATITTSMTIPAMIMMSTRIIRATITTAMATGMEAMTTPTTCEASASAL